MRVGSIITSACVVFLSIWPVEAGTYSGGAGNIDSPYQIGSAADWQELMAATDDWDSYFILTANIDLNEVSVTPIAPDTDVSSGFQGTAFTGVFDGRGYVISHAVINRPAGEYVGLFGYVAAVGQIKNLTVENVSITGLRYVGGLAGYNYGNISWCNTAGSVGGEYTVGGLAGYNNGVGTISFCGTAAVVSGTEWPVGGLVGYNGSTAVLICCYATGTVTGGSSHTGGLVGNNYGSVTSCYATGVVSGGMYSGGLAGYNCGSVSLCYATGAVGSGAYAGGLVGDNYAGNVKWCYARGDVAGTANYVGGLIGYNYQGKVIRCYSTGKPTGTTEIGGLCGYKVTGGGYEDTGNFWDKETSKKNSSTMGTGTTTALMYVKTTFTGTPALWDFVGETANGTEDMWRMCVDGIAYPRLNGEYAKNGDFQCANGVGLEDVQYLSGQWLNQGWCNLNDRNRDGRVDLRDFVKLAAEESAGEKFAGFAKVWLANTCHVFRYEDADLNGDNQVNLADFVIFADYWLGGE